MRTQKLQFNNSQGHKLTAYLELPLDSQPHNFVLFAHCFTCNKNFAAVRNISRALTIRGMGVLRFDFTGLGESEGDFADTNFSSNVADLVAAANYLGKEYKLPTVLIGHSLGGAAALVAVHHLPSIEAVVTIGSPYDPAHVKHLLKGGLEEIDKEGVADINIGGREFTIKKQFVEDLDTIKSHHLIQDLDTALLVMHSPQDAIVDIENATKIYKAAQHPRSFVSLDGADHLLSKKSDSLYVGDVIAAWASRYIVTPTAEPLSTDKQVVTRIGDEGYTTEIKAGNHGFIADEPISVGGNDFGPTPYDLLMAALGSCTTMTLRMYANYKKWDLQEVQVHLQHDKIHAQDCEKDDAASKVDYIDRVIELEGNLDEEQRKRLMEIADRCPVHKTLTGEVKVETKLKS